MKSKIHRQTIARSKNVRDGEVLIHTVGKISKKHITISDQETLTGDIMIVDLNDDGSFEKYGKSQKIINIHNIQEEWEIETNSIKIHLGKCFVDYDSMLYDLQLAAFIRTKEIYGIDLTYEDVTSWNFFKQYPEAIKAYSEWEHYSKGEHFEDSVWFMEQLYKIFGKENVFIITNSHPSLIENKDEEIKKVYGIAQENIIHEADKHLITGDNFLLDDYGENIKNHVNHNSNGIGVLFDYQGRYGWNKENIEDNHHNIHRITTYQEIIFFIQDKIN